MGFPRNRVFFILFFISGFCGLLYQMIWIRLAFAAFGVITPVLSVVISVFMLGLALGSWGGGRYIQLLTQNNKINPVMFYALAELGIGIGAFLVPILFSQSANLLLTSGETDSFSYLLLSAILIAISLIPWCVLMGTTFPFMMAFARQTDGLDVTSFSFLYLANSLGAMTGTFVATFVLIELFGFRHTLWIGGTLNLLISAVSLALGFSARHEIRHLDASQKVVSSPTVGNQDRWDHTLLFMTGVVSMAMEVAWFRASTPIIGTQVYAYALLLFYYLLATCAGSHFYRKKRLSGRGIASTPELVGILSITIFLPIVMNDPRLQRFFSPLLGTGARVIPFICSIMPFCFVLGYLTPSLVDKIGLGKPKGAGKAYAFNIVGCILGPLIASYVLLPWLGAKLSIEVLALPLIFFLIGGYKTIPTGRRLIGGLVWSCLVLCSLLICRSSEDPFEGTVPHMTKRDYTATVISLGNGLQKQMLVNGVGITSLTPITKYMAHLPMAYSRIHPRNALVICFGMGTTFRSLLSWNVETTAVELLPAVKDSFGYFFSDAEACLQNPKGKVIIDDGRRFLKRTETRFDVITIDPPPPAEAAGSSLLYSDEFYTLIKMRLAQEGILQQWFAVGEEKTLQAVAQSLKVSFPFVRVYPSVEGWGYPVEGWGYHFLASKSPIEPLTVEEIIGRLPSGARHDLDEWGEIEDLRKDLTKLISQEVPIEKVLPRDSRIRITDDRPFNEYFLVRRLMPNRM